MTSPFAILIPACGLSQREAAEFLRVPVNTIKGWMSGRRTVPHGVMEELAQLLRRIDCAVTDLLILVADTRKQPARQGAADEVALTTFRDDAEAKTKGWPCAAAYGACLARVIAAGMGDGIRFRLVTLEDAPDLT